MKKPRKRGLVDTRLLFAGETRVILVVGIDVRDTSRRFAVATGILPVLLLFDFSAITDVSPALAIKVEFYLSWVKHDVLLGH